MNSKRDHRMSEESVPETGEIILLNFTGANNPGITSVVTKILADYNASILDLGAANIHNSLSLAVMFEADPTKSGDILKSLLFKSSELGIFLKFTSISHDEYQNWCSQHGKNKYIVTVLGRKLKPHHIALVTKVLSDKNINIETIMRLTGRINIDQKQNKSCFEMILRGDIDANFLHQQFMELSLKHNFDISIQKESMFRTMRRVICFDMDSTLIQTEVIDELAERAGVGDQVKQITESAMRGEIDFTESLKKRVSLLKGLDTSVMQDIASNLPITDGMERLIKILKTAGYKLCILSGGFAYFGNYLRNKYGFDHVFANELEIRESKLTGELVGEIVDGKRKAELLKMIAQFEKVDVRQTVAVGDGANDLPMLATAGLGIAFHAKPKVKAAASHSLSTVGLDGVLYFLGFRDSQLDIED